MVSAKSIVFVSLFLGVTAGSQQVEVAVDRSVAAVELRLDGEAVARLGGPPWSVEVDLGAELAPHHLEALAFDTAGEEVGRAEQWINLPRERYELRLLLERGGGRVTGGRLAWDALEYDAPAALRLSFDGDEIATDDRSAFELPRHDAGELHVVSAEAVFPDGGTARADAVFGGRYGEETATELTAVPLLAGGRWPNRPEQADGWLVAGGQPARVAAIDRGAVDLYAVTDEGALDHLARLALAIRDRAEAGPVSRFRAGGSPLYGVGLRKGDRLFLVNPRVEKETAYDLFGISTPFAAKQGGTSWLLATLRFPLGAPGQPPRLADAVATASLSAAGGGRPRAVVLILGPDAVDVSLHRPAIVRRFLDRLRVPLAVWYVEQLDLVVERAEAEAEAVAEAKRKLVPPGVRIDPEPVDVEALRAGREARLAAARARWGEVTDVTDLGAWLDACRELRDVVGRQGVLWIEGAHPPGAVTLGAAPEGVRLAGAADGASGGG